MFEVIKGLDGRRIEIPKTTPTFLPWAGTEQLDNYGGKAILDFEGQPSFAELLVLRLFEGSGWSGIWVDSFARCNRRFYWGENTSVVLPDSAETLLKRIRGRDSKARCWDIFCWGQDQYLFAELKRKSHDHIRDSQRRWLAAALEEGLDSRNFLIIEWEIKPIEAV